MNEERTKILEMLQQGQITVEQADRLLEALEQSLTAEAPPEKTESETAEATATDWGAFGRNLAEQVKRDVGETMREIRDLGKGFRRASIPRIPPRPERPAHRGPGLLLTSLESGDWLEELRVECTSGGLEFVGTDEAEVRVLVYGQNGRVKPGESGWEGALPWGSQREESRLVLTLGSAQDPKATDGLSFRVEVPSATRVSAETGGGDMSAASLARDVSLTTRGGNLNVNDVEGRVAVTTRGGDVSVQDVEGEVTADTGGGNLNLQDVQGNVTAHSGGGNVGLQDVEGDVRADTGGGDMHLHDISGVVDARTGGGNVGFSDISGNVTAHTGGGDMSLKDITGEVTGRTGAGNLRLSDIEGPVTVETGAGDISFEDIKGSVSGRTGVGNIRIRGVDGDAVVDTGLGRISASDVSGEVKHH